MSGQWTQEDMDKAREQGWGVWAVWDQDKLRTERIIQRSRAVEIFKTDEAARQFVGAMSMGGDKLAQKAVAIVIASKLPGGTK